MQSKNFLTEMWSILNKATGQDDWGKVAYYRNPDSLLDEALIFLWVIVAACVVFTGGFGLYYHFVIFDNAFDTWAYIAGGFSAFMFVLGEILKVGLGLVLGRMLLTGNWARSISRVATTLVIATLVVGAYLWSYNISATSASSVNEELGRRKLYTGQMQAGAPALLADVDGQLAALQAEKEKLRSMKVESGQVSWPAQQAILQITKQENELAAQRTALLAQHMDEKQGLLATEMSIVQEVALRLSEYGGKAEWLLALCILGICFMERSSYENNRDALKEKQPKPGSETTGKTIPLKQPVEDQAATNIRAIGFQVIPKAPETTEPSVEQLFQRETAPVKQPATVLVKQADVRYLKQRLKQSWRRCQTQLDNTTPRENLEYFRQQLTELGYTVNLSDNHIEIIDPER